MRKNFMIGCRGQATIEILVALMLLVMGIGSAAIIVFGSRSLTTESSLSSQALRLARGEVEEARAFAKNDFGGLANSSSVQDIFTKETLVEVVGENTKKVTGGVRWRIEPFPEQKVELVTLVTNWELVSDSGGDTGGSGTTGDWQHPQTLGSIDLGAGNSATGLDVVNKIVYVSAVASDSKKDDIVIIDATNGQSPVIRSSTSTGPGLNGIEAVEQYVYAANNAVSGQLQVIDVSAPANPQFVTSFTLPDVSGSGAVGNSIFFFDGKIYLGTLQASGPELHIIDVSTPSTPSSLGSFEVDADVNSIIVSGNFAYLATSDNAKELLVLNVENPSNIIEAGSYNAADTHDGKSVYLKGTTLYLGRNSGNDKEFFVLNVASSTAISLLGSQEIGADVNGIRTRETLAFLGTSQANQEFQVWNISDPNNITLWSSFNFPQVATWVDYEDNIVYVSVRSNDALRIITSQ